MSMRPKGKQQQIDRFFAWSERQARIEAATQLSERVESDLFLVVHFDSLLILQQNPFIVLIWI